MGAPAHLGGQRKGGVMSRSTWLSLAVAAGLAIALPAASTAAGCCQLTKSCLETDSERLCKALGGAHSQLGFCAGDLCQPSISEGPVDGVPIDPRENAGALNCSSEEPVQAPAPAR